MVLEADEQSYRKVLSQMLASMQGISDRVERSDMGVAYVGLDGLEDMYGGDARLVNSLLNAAPQDLAPRVGVAHAKFPALVAATVQYAPLGATRVPADAASFLAPHSIDLLPVDSHGEGCHTPLRTARHGRRGRDGVGKDRGPVRSHGQGRRGTCAMALTTAPWRP